MIMKEADSEIYLNILSIDLFNSLPENYKSRIYPVIVLYECSRHGPLARDRENEWLKAS